MSEYTTRVHGLQGRVFGRLTVLRRHGKTAYNEATWKCKCECGTQKIVQGKNLRNGSTVSCGCFKNEMLAINGIKHGMKGTPEYSTWAAMKRRCCAPDDKDYPRYGGKGITLCDEWRESFESFYNHIGPRPNGTTVDRIKNHLGYEPGNVRWATAKEQQNNRTNNIHVTTLRGDTIPIGEAARILGITHGAAILRYKRGKLHV